MDNICGLIDVQGFYHAKKFYPREIAVLADDAIICIYVNTKLSIEDLTDDEARQASFNFHFTHGIKFESHKDHMSIEHVPNFLKMFYKARIDGDRFLIGCKTKEAEDVLRDAIIPRINLTKYGATWSNIMKPMIACPLHKNGGEPKCSLRVVLCLSEWLSKHISKIN